MNPNNQTAKSCDRNRSLLEVLELEASAFVRAVTEMKAIIVLSNNIKEKDGFLSSGDRNVIAEHLDRVAGEITKLGARSALASANRLRRDLVNTDSPITHDQLNRAMMDIESRFADHLNDIRLFVLNQGETSLMQSADNLLSVADMPVEGFSLAFPNASFEIEEAAKCCALSRYTASVFHCMRALEWGIKALCALLDVPDATKPVERNWGIVLRAIHAAIEAKHPKATRLPQTTGASSSPSTPHWTR